MGLGRDSWFFKGQKKTGIFFKHRQLEDLNFNYVHLNDAVGWYQNLRCLSNDSFTLGSYHLR